MKKFSLKAISTILIALIFMASVNVMFLTASAVTENGYDRGYDGGFKGDGKIYCEGLDLSSWQEGAVNFKAVAAMGYDYVIFRLGTSKMTERDRCFDTFYNQAKAAGLDVGAYFYSYATTQAAVEEDIAKCKEWLKGYKLEYPFYFDYEDKTQADLPASTALSIINTFMDAFVEEGYLMGLYSMKAWLTQSWIVNSQLPDKYEGWIAHYAGDGTYDAGYSKYGDTYSTQYGMYQYTDKHYFIYNGVKYGPYDADICYKDYPSIVKEYGFNGYEPQGTAAAKESLKKVMDMALSISHRDYAESTILSIRQAYKDALSLTESETATKEELENAQETLTELLGKTGSNTIAYNNAGIEIKGRNRKVTSGDVVLYSPTWNDGVITVSNANIAYTTNVVFKWDEYKKVNVVKSVSEGIGLNTPDIRLEADEFLIAGHDWESGVTSGAVAGSAENVRILSALKPGDMVRLSGATALNAGTDVEIAAFAKFMPQGSVRLYQRNEAVTKGSAALFTPDMNDGVLTAQNSNVHLTLNVRAKWDNPNNAWVVTEKFSGNKKTDSSSNVTLASDEVLIALYYDSEDTASLSNWYFLESARVGQKINFSGISPQSYSTGVSISANISFEDLPEEEKPEVTPENISSTSKVEVQLPGELKLSAALTDGVADTTLEGDWFGFVTDAGDANCNTEAGVGTVTIDLGKQFDINSVMTHFYIGDAKETLGGYTVGAPQRVKLSVSLDGNIFYQAGELDLGGCAVGTCWATVDNAQAVARYIRLEVTCSEGLVLLNEVKVMGAEHKSTLQNIALGKDYVSPVYPSSPYDADLTDGKYTSVFESGVNDSSWFGFKNTGDQSTGNINPNNSDRGIATIDLGGMAQVSDVRVNLFAGENSAGAGPFDYINVYYSTDGVSYRYLEYIGVDTSKTSSYWTGLSKSVEPVYARYIKLAVGASQGELVLINEIEVLGTMLTQSGAAQVGSMSTVTLVGEFNNWNATPNMKVVQENVVETTLTLSKGRYEFKILGGNSWYGYNGEINNTTDKIDPQGIVMYSAGFNGVLVAAGGEYSFRYNKMTNRLTVSYVPDTVYIRGTFNDWGTENVMEEMGEGIYTASLTLNAGDYEFKAANEDYSMEWPQFNQTLSLDRKSVVTFELDLFGNSITTSSEALEYFVTFVDYKGAVIKTETVEKGKGATAPEAPARKGYEFVGWDKDITNVTADIRVAPRYKQTHGTLKIDISGGAGFTIAVNGASPRPQGNYYVNTNMPIGVPVTVTAKSTTDKEFLGWVRADNGGILSEDVSYTFYTTGKDEVKAMFKTDIDSVNMVIFKNDKQNRILDMQYYAPEDEIVFPKDPQTTGFDFDGWDHTEEEIKEKLSRGEDVTVLAKWTIKPVYFNLLVSGGFVKDYTDMNQSGEYLAYRSVTVEANAPAQGTKFAFWLDKDGKVKSYDSVYKFYISEDTELTAVYVEESLEVDVEVLVDVVMDTAYADASNNIIFSWCVPEAETGYTFVKAGILLVSGSNYNEGTFTVGTDDQKVTQYSPKDEYQTADNSFSVIKKGVNSGDTWVVRAWVQYYNAQGELCVAYSDTVFGTKL